MMAVSSRNMQQWTDVMNMYLYVQFGGLTKILLFQSSVLFYKVG